MSLNFFSPTLLQFYKYISISVLGYVSILSLMFLLIDVMHTNKSLAFFIAYALAYTAGYLLNLKYLFYKKHNTKILLKFALQIFLSLVIGSIVFRALLLLGINYLVSTLLTAGVLLPIRFISQKFLVFR
ncbi:GtrA family protein [Pseudomonas helvetica]|uniref:GtrA family protein n=1 Tax=Pseudomonas helvetica TaxID=3136738 RepID=UPI00346139B1